MIARLPMYDWPEIAAETDAMWATLRDMLRDQGLTAPEGLSRGGDGDVLFAQTCGLPWVRNTHPSATLLGRPDYAVEGWGDGAYRSAIVARRGSGLDVAALPDAQFVANGLDSLSGWLAARDHLGADAVADPVISGAHRASIRMVADSHADFAAIDAFCLFLANRHEPATDALEVIAWTPPRPAMPFFTGPATPPDDVDILRRTLPRLPARLPENVRAAIPLTAVHPADPEDFAPIARMWFRAKG